MVNILVYYDELVIQYLDELIVQYLDEYEYTYRFAKDKLILTEENNNTGEIKTVSFVRGQMP